MTTTPEPVFEQASPDINLYWLSGGGRLAGFRPSGPVELGTSITLSQSWTDSLGLWFWLDAAPDDDAAFVATLATYLDLLPPMSGPRALWLSGAAGDMAQWRSHHVDMRRNGEANVVSAGATFNVHGVRVAVANGSQVTIGEFTHGHDGWGFILDGTPGLVFATLDGLQDAAGGRLGLSYGPGQTGCLVWTMDLPVASDGLLSGLENLGVSLRFFGPDAVSDGHVSALIVHPLRQTTPVTLYCVFDPLAPLDFSRTRLALLPFNATLDQPPNFDSGYVTARGYGVTLVPGNQATATPPGFVFGAQPLVTGNPAADDDAVPLSYYLTPDGDFTLTVHDQPGQWITASGASADATAPLERLLCGMTGQEYVGLSAATGNVLSFRAGHPAYAPPGADKTPTNSSTSPSTNSSGLEPAPPALTDQGTTAWSWLSGGDALRYYAQPEDAPFYAAGDEGFLNYLEISAADLTTPDTAPAFPMVGYAGLDHAQIMIARDLEARGLAPERRRQIGRLTGAQWMPAASQGAPLAPPNTLIPAVSPPGLAIGYAGDDQPWPWLAIGNTGTSYDGLPDLRFTAVDGAFRQALLTNRLFMVLGDAQTVLANGSVAYQLTQTSLGLIKALPPAKGVPITIYEDVAVAVAAAGYKVYPTETAFNAMLEQASPGITAEQRLVFQRFGGLLSPAIGDWFFRLSPRNWAALDRDGPKHARLVFKFVGGRSIEELVVDTASWSWPEASSSDGKASTARDDILSIIREAREAQATAKAKNMTSPYDNFLQIVDDKHWTGVLALSVEVPLNSLPEPLQPLAAGIDPTSFYAHHLGLAATSFTSSDETIEFDITSSFGLIDYQNPIDQYFSSDIAFAFRVQQLTAGFENGKLSSFTSSVQLMVNRLFGTETRLFPSEHGNNLILDGVYQTEHGSDGDQRDTYVFAMRDAGTFQLSLGQLSEVTVDGMRMVTVRAADPAGGDTTVTAAFQMNGRLSFTELDDFDPFCWGPSALVVDTPDSIHADDDGTDAASIDGLRYTNYAITMSFPLSDPATVKFTVAEAAMALDTANSVARENSLFNRFPLRLTGITGTPDPKVTGDKASDLTPATNGFVSVSAPLQQGRLSQPWYGLVYEVDLGTLGALAGSAGVTLRLLAAWSSGGDTKGTPAIYFGVALPGIESALGVSLPLQGILDIGFRTIQFSTYDDAQARRQYLMHLRDFGLHVLGLSFPPGHNDIAVFGNPDQTSNTKLGWYAAYDSGKSESGKNAMSTRRDTMGPGDRLSHNGKQQRPSSQETARRIRAARPPRVPPSREDEL